MAEIIDFTQTDQLTLVFKYFTTYVLLLGLLKFAFDAPDIFKSIVGSLGDAAKGKFNGLLEAKKIGEDTKKAAKGVYDHSVGAAVNTAKNVYKAGKNVYKAGSNTLQTGLGVAGGVVGATQAASEAAKDKTGFKALGAGLVGGVRGLVKGGAAAKGTKVSFIDGVTPGDAMANAKVTATLEGIKAGDKQAAAFNTAAANYESIMKNAYGDSPGIKKIKDEMDKAKKSKDEAEAYARQKRRDEYVALESSDRTGWESLADTYRNEELAKKAKKRGYLDASGNGDVAAYSAAAAAAPATSDIAEEFNKINNKYNYSTLDASEVSRNMAAYKASIEVKAAKDAIDQQKRDIAILYGEALGKKINQRNTIILETDKVLKAQEELAISNAEARVIIDDTKKSVMKKFSEDAEAKILEDLSSSYTGVANCTKDFGDMLNMYNQIKAKSNSGATLSDQENAALKIITDIVKDVSSSANSGINDTRMMYEAVVKSNSGK